MSTVISQRITENLFRVRKPRTLPIPFTNPIKITVERTVLSSAKSFESITAKRFLENVTHVIHRKVIPASKQVL